MKRFWDKVNIGGEDDCWLWQASKFPKGYGSFNLRCKTRRAHRVSWEITYGPIPKGMQVLHKCDNPSCVNPKHLFLGTNADNMHDRDLKNRGAGRFTGGPDPRRFKGLSA